MENTPPHFQDTFSFLNENVYLSRNTFKMAFLSIVFGIRYVQYHVSLNIFKACFLKIILSCIQKKTLHMTAH